MPGPLLDLTVQQPPAQNPLQTIGALANLRDMQSQTQLRAAQMQAQQAQTADVEAQAQARNRDLADQNTLQEIEADPDAYGKIFSGDYSPVAGKVQDSTLAKIRTNVNAALQAKATQTEDSLKTEALANGHIGDALASLGTLRNPDGTLDLPGVNAAIPGVVQGLSTDFGVLKIDPAQLPTSITDEKQLDSLAAHMKSHAAFVSAAQKYKADQQKILTDQAAGAKDTGAANASNAEAAKTNALLPGEVAEQATKNQIAQADADFRAKNGGLSANEVALNNIAKGNLSVSRAEQQIRQKTFDATYGPNAQQTGLAGVRPNLVAPAAASYEKAGVEFATAQGAADAMQSVLDLAAKGNKAAGSNLPLVGVETLNALNGIKRVNGAEIAQYGNAGSLLDKIQGKIGSLTVGKPIPQDVLDDIRQLHTTIAQEASTTYQRKVQVANKTYGSKFEPVQFAPAAAAGVAPILLKDGRTLTPSSQAQADAFRKDHPELIQ